MLLIRAPLPSHFLSGPGYHRICNGSKILEKPQVIICKSKERPHVSHILRSAPISYNLQLRLRWCCKRPGVVGPYHSNQIGTLFAFVSSFRDHVLSPATLPRNWGTLMATEYGITSFTLARDVGCTGPTYGWHGHNSSKVTQSLDKSQCRPRQTRQEKHGQKNHKVWMVPSANTTSLQRYICAINYLVLPPNTVYSSNIQRIESTILAISNITPPL